MPREWADDPGTRRAVAVVCENFEACDWRGSAVVVTQYGATDYQPEECPQCGGAIEPDVCQTCHGSGYVIEVRPDIVPDPPTYYTIPDRTWKACPTCRH